MTLNRRDRVTLEMYRQKAGNQQFQNFGNLVNKAIGEPSVGSITKAGLSGAKGIAQRAMADARRLGTGTSLRDRSIAQTFRDEGRDPRISTPLVQTQANLPSNRDTLERNKPLPRVDQIQEQTPGIPTPEKLTDSRKKQLEEYISPEGSEEAWNDFYDDSKRQAQWEILTNQKEPRTQPLVTSNTTDTQNPLVPTPNQPVKTTPVKPKVTKNTTALPKPKRKSSDKKIVPSKAEKAKTKSLKETTDKTIKKVEEKTPKTTSTGTPLAKGFDDQVLAGLLGVGIGVGTNQLLQPTPQPKDPNPQYDRYYR